MRSLARDEFLADFRNVEAAKHLLQTAIEAMLDVAVQLVARMGEPLPEQHAGLFEILARRGVLPAERVDVYRKMVGFRNRVVHLYDRVDDARVYEIVQSDLPDFERFAHEILSGPMGEEGPTEPPA